MSLKNAVRIVGFDIASIDHGDIDWSRAAALGKLELYPNTAGLDRQKILDGAYAFVTSHFRYDRATLSACRGIRYIGVGATGYDRIDVGLARELSVPLTNVPDYSTASVAQHVFALILEFYTHTGLFAENVRSGAWSRCDDFCLFVKPTHELAGKTVGIVGYGQIGRAVARIAKAFGMRTLAAALPDKKYPAREKRTEIERVFANSDIVTLHCPLTERTRGLVGVRLIGLMKKNALLINTARGGLIDERALADALNSGAIAGAGLDVLSSEPPPQSNPLTGAANCLITPHVAWGTVEARQRLADELAANLKAFLDGKRRNRIC